MNTLPTAEQHKDYLRHLDAARQLYKWKKYEEGWNYVVDHAQYFPEEKISEMFVEFIWKILQQEKNKPKPWVFNLTGGK